MSSRMTATFPESNRVACWRAIGHCFRRREGSPGPASRACSVSHALGVGIFFAVALVIAGIGRVLVLYAMERRAVKSLQIG